MKSKKIMNNIWDKGGSHYKNFVIQPAQFINKNRLLFAEGNVIKYVCRHKNKNRSVISYAQEFKILFQNTD